MGRDTQDPRLPTARSTPRRTRAVARTRGSYPATGTTRARPRHGHAGAPTACGGRTRDGERWAREPAVAVHRSRYRPPSPSTGSLIRPTALCAALLTGALLLAACGDDTVDPASAEPEPSAAADDDAAPSDADGVSTDDGDDVDGDHDAGSQPPEIDPAETAAEVAADELGQIPVLMYHRLLDDGGDFDNTPEEFRQELIDLHEAGYRFITTAEMATGEIDIPAGTTPAVLTFDDSTREQFGLTDDGEVDPDTAVGIMLELADELDGFRATGSFYVLGSLFGVSDERGQQLLAELHELGFELGNHSASHANLRQLDAEGVQRELVLGQRNILDAVPDAEVTTLSLPFGSNPDDPSLLAAGSHDGFDYTHDAALLVGSGPAHSPFHGEFDPIAIPRIRSQPVWSEGDEVDFGSGYWLSVLADEPERRYVSDGDATTIAIPAEREDELADDLDPDAVVTY